MKQRGAYLPQLFPTSVFHNVEDSIHVSTFKATAVKKKNQDWQNNQHHRVTYYINNGPHHCSPSDGNMAVLWSLNI